ncbi:MAG: HNH endonuclease signature motif containing protein [Mycobacterium sp.]
MDSSAATAFAEAITAFDTAVTNGLDGAGVAELLAIESQLENLARRIPAAEHHVLAALRTRTSPSEIGARTWADVLSLRLLISSRDAQRRVREADVLGPRTALTGQPLDPIHPATAAAQSRGEITAEHVRIILSTIEQLPAGVDAATRGDAEALLAAIAAEQAPEALRKAARHLLDVIDPDGPEPEDEAAERRAAMRGFVLGPQRADGMSEFGGVLTPEARAYIEPVFAKLAAKGMANPNDPSPCVKGTPSAETAAADRRSLAQRQHDAFAIMGRQLLASGELGQHNGLPVTAVVTTTLQELESGAGVARTGGGSTLPMPEFIRMAAHAFHYLTIFDAHTTVALYLGRSKRIATPGQRLVLSARDRGCTFPGCTIPPYLCQTHHADTDFSAGGNTDIDNEALACGPHNRLVKEGGWKTRIRRDGSAEWIPPPLLDTGRSRVNLFHHPERLVGSRDPQPAAPPDRIRRGRRCRG